MVTIEDIAKRAKVSSATVSRVLSNKNSVIQISVDTQKLVRSIAEEMNYVPNAFAQSLRTKKSNIVGVVVWDLMEPFYLDILKGIDEILDKSNYNLMLSSAKEDEKIEQICFNKLQQIRADGILIVGGPRSFQNHEMAEIMKKPIVFVGTENAFLEAASVTVDNYHGGIIGAEHLISLKPEQIVFMGGIKSTIDLDGRWRGFNEVIEKNNLSSICRLVRIGPGEKQAYTSAMTVLKQCSLPVAVFARNDISALGVMRAARDSNLRIPQDVAILGFDNLSMSEFVEPQLTTIHQPKFLMGKIGTQILVDLLNGKELTEKERHVSLRPELIVRKST